MNRQPNATTALLLAALLLVAGASSAAPADGQYLYVIAPGVRNYLEYGGAGILVFDVAENHKFVRRIETPASRREQPENIKGVCASAAAGRLYFSTPTRLFAIDLIAEQPLWEKELPQGCDRMSITPDGRCLYVPSFERDIWNVVDAASGDVLATIETKSGAHNTVCGSSGRWMYLAGLRSPNLSVADTQSHRLARHVGPFSAPVRPFTVDHAEKRVYACVNELLGFEIGDLETGQVIGRVEVPGYAKGAVKRHGCPSHGIGLTPDETQIWVCDAHNQRLHVFDIVSAEPRLIGGVALRDEPGWVTFSIDGRYAYSSTGEVIDIASRKILVALTDEAERPVQSEKVIEIHFAGGKPTKVGDQFGVGRKGQQR